MNDSPNSAEVPDIAAFRRGESWAFRAVVRRMQAGLFGFFGRMGFGQTDSEELVQDVFLTVWRYRDRFDPARAALSTWVYVIARNLALNELTRRRKGSRFRAPGGGHSQADAMQCIPADPATTDPLYLAERGQRLRMLRAALLNLGEDDRLAIALFYVQALSVDEAASVFGCKPGAFRTRLSRARKRLADIAHAQQHEGDIDE